jgi:hypothetical protein
MHKIKYIKQSEAIVRSENSQYKVENFITKESNENLSLAISKLNGETP